MILVVLFIYVPLILGVVGGLGYFLLRIRSGGSVDERLGRIERKVGRLEATVEDLNDRLDDEP